MIQRIFLRLSVYIAIFVWLKMSVREELHETIPGEPDGGVAAPATPGRKTPRAPSGGHRGASPSDLWNFVELTGATRGDDKKTAEREVRCKIYGCSRPMMWEKMRSNARIWSHMSAEHALDSSAMKAICDCKDTLRDVLERGHEKDPLERKKARKSASSFNVPTKPDSQTKLQTKIEPRSTEALKLTASYTRNVVVQHGLSYRTGRHMKAFLRDYATVTGAARVWDGAARSSIANCLKGDTDSMHSLIQAQWAQRAHPAMWCIHHDVWDDDWKRPWAGILCTFLTEGFEHKELLLGLAPLSKWCKPEDRVGPKGSIHSGFIVL